MSEPFVGEIRLIGCNFAPVGWAFCNGALVPITENETLFNLIGTTYGGDGQSTFALPDLRGRVPIHMGAGGGGSYVIGETFGEETVTLTAQQLPPHNHQVNVATFANEAGPSGHLPAPTSNSLYAYGLPVPLKACVTSTGGGQPHDNLQPYVAMNYIISLFGIFPSQN